MPPMQAQSNSSALSMPNSHPNTITITITNSHTSMDLAAITPVLSSRPNSHSNLSSPPWNYRSRRCLPPS